MTQDIEPALSASEWKDQRALRPEGTAVWPISYNREHPGLHVPVTAAVSFHVSKPPALVAVIAIANAALPDSDPRKITRDMVTLLRRIAYTEVAEEDGEGSYDSANLFEGKEMDALMELADALASYLPPEGT